jgi:predicted transposase YdaD
LLLSASSCQQIYVTDAWYEAEINWDRVEGALEEKQRQQQTIALNLLRKNIALETIAEATELSIEHLQILQSQLGNI